MRRGPPWWHGRFRRFGHRLTAPRETILNTLSKTQKHLSAEDIYLEVHKIYPAVGLTTVYRTLELLVRMGWVYKFDFGDASDNQPQVWSQTTNVAYHKYQLSGEYTAKVDVQDQAGNWRGSDDCRVTIKVNDQPQVLGLSVPSELPSTGVSVLGALALVPVGIVLRKRFRLV